MTTADLKNAIVSFFMTSGMDATVADLAEVLGCGETTVRKALIKEAGCPVGCTVREEHRESKSKSYIYMSVGAHKVTVYGPSRDTLRLMVKASRGAW